MLHRIRLAMQTGSFNKFEGEVEVDESFIGGEARPDRGSGLSTNGALHDAVLEYLR